MRKCLQCLISSPLTGNCNKNVIVYHLGCVLKACREHKLFTPVSEPHTHVTIRSACVHMTSRYALNRMRVMGELTVNRSLAFHLPPGGLIISYHMLLVLATGVPPPTRMHAPTRAQLASPSAAHPSCACCVQRTWPAQLGLKYWLGFPGRRACYACAAFKVSDKSRAQPASDASNAPGEVVCWARSCSHGLLARQEAVNEGGLQRR